MSNPAPAAAAAVAPLTRWDHLLPAARQAGEHGLQSVLRSDARNTGYAYERTFAFVYTGGVVGAIETAFPDRDEGERALMLLDAQLAWGLREFDKVHETDGLYKAMRAQFNDVGNMKYPFRIIHCIHRIRSHSAAWEALTHRFQLVQADPSSPAAELLVARVVRDGSHEMFASSVDRARFDASQVERHMAMQHRVPAELTNLIGQFATDGITTQTPIPMRLQVKHKLELLTRRMASLTAAQVATEMRLIMGDVEESLPEDERTLKKARK